jgi:hypothetical protein
VGKLAPRRDGPYRVTAVSGRMMQRITMVGASGRELHCHASKLVLHSGPVDESTWAPPSHAVGRARLAAEEQLQEEPPARQKRKRPGAPSHLVGTLS